MFQLKKVKISTEVCSVEFETMCSYLLYHGLVPARENYPLTINHDIKLFQKFICHGLL